MSTQQLAGVSSPNDSDSASEPRKSRSQESIESKHAGGPASPLAPALAAEGSERMESALGDALLRLLRIRKGPKNGGFDLDATATQPSIWDSENIEEYKALYIHPQWENYSAFDPSFRWTYREENAVRHKVDWKIMVWVCVMFAALDIDRGNISNAVSDNLLDDLGLTTSDYNLGQTLSKIGFLLAELPSQLISKRLGPDLWIPIQICIFSFISGAQFFLQGRASFLATRFLVAVFQGGFIPDMVLYLSYWYTGRRVSLPISTCLSVSLNSSPQLPIRLAWFWTSSQLVQIGVGFAAVGLLSLRGVLGYAGWRWLFLVDQHEITDVGDTDLVAVLVGLASFFFMPQSPAKTKSWWNPKGYFTEREVKIIVNSVIRDDPGKAGMYNRQGLTVGQIWKCAKDYDMWPLYALGLLFGIPKYPVSQYLTLSFRRLGFNVIQSNLLSIPNVVASSITMLLITAVSELVKNRSLVAMAEDLWLLPNFAALIALPDPIAPWSYFAIATVLLSFPYTHPIQVAWTSRNAGSVQQRTVSAAFVHSFLHACLYQPGDAPRYFKANTGLLVICIWMVVVQYPGTYLYYRRRNSQKARIWDAMTPEEQDEYRKTTTDVGNKRLDFRFAT
ncbi:major facilitator superfamily transporter [Xylaria longipes]|nr:major facilitator superfamily transporter [Xylaria longipes]